MSAASAFNLDLSTLLAPISQQSPAGESLRYEGTYDRIMEARREEDANLAQGVWKRELKKADWNQVNQICLESLHLRSKDLQIAAWMLEALIHLHGFSGARAGCEAMVELCHTFWDAMYPTMEDPEYRLAPIHWMNEKLFTQLKFIPITSPQGPGENLSYCFSDWETAFLLEQNKQAAQLKKNPKTITLESIRQSAYLTPVPFLDSMIEDINAAYQSCHDLEEIFDNAFGQQSCSLGQFRGTLESIVSVLSSFRDGREAIEEPESQAEPVQEYALEPVTTHEAGAIPLLPPIRSRAEAYRRLAEAADYLARTEPHSPAPYLIRRAITWGSMTLDQLLPELLGNDATLKELERLLNIDTIVKNHESRKK